MGIKMASGQGSGDGFRKCIRLAMILANLLILIGAFSILAVGIWTIVDKSYLQDLMRNKLYMSAAYVLIAVGAITIILSVIGCLGSFTEKRLLLLAYFIFVLLMFVVLLLGGVFAYVFRQQIKTNLNINSGDSSAKVPASCCKLNEDGAKVDCSSDNPV